MKTITTRVEYDGESMDITSHVFERREYAYRAVDRFQRRHKIGNGSEAPWGALSVARWKSKRDERNNQRAAFCDLFFIQPVLCSDIAHEVEHAAQWFFPYLYAAIGRDSSNIHASETLATLVSLAFIDISKKVRTRKQ